MIQGYTVVVDHAALGRPLEAFCELRFSGARRGSDEIAAVGDAIPEVEAVFTMAGDPDALACRCACATSPTSSTLSICCAAAAG